VLRIVDAAEGSGPHCSFQYLFYGWIGPAGEPGDYRVAALITMLTSATTEAKPRSDHPRSDEGWTYPLSLLEVRRRSALRRTSRATSS